MSTNLPSSRGWSTSFICVWLPQLWGCPWKDEADVLSRSDKQFCMSYCMLRLILYCWPYPLSKRQYISIHYFSNKMISFTFFIPTKSVEKSIFLITESFIILFVNNALYDNKSIYNLLDSAPYNTQLLTHTHTQTSPKTVGLQCLRYRRHCLHLFIITVIQDMHHESKRTIIDANSLAMRVI